VLEIGCEQRVGKGGLYGLEEGRACFGGAGVECWPAETEEAVVGGVGGEFGRDGLGGLDGLGGCGYGADFD